MACRTDCISSLFLEEGRCHQDQDDQDQKASWSSSPMKEAKQSNLTSWPGRETQSSSSGTSGTSSPCQSWRKKFTSLTQYVPCPPEQLLGPPLVGSKASHLPDQVADKLIMFSQLALGVKDLKYSLKCVSVWNRNIRIDQWSHSFLPCYGWA